MKTSKKIVIFIFGVILAAILAVIIFFPGLPWYIRIKREYNNINKSVETFPECDDVSKEYIKYSGSGISLLAPDGLEITEENNIGKCFSDDNTEIFITEPMLGDYIINYRGETLSEESLRYFCESISFDIPKSEYDKYNLSLSLSMDNFNIHNPKQAEAFYKLFDKKNLWFNQFEYIYRLDKENFKGFLRIHELGGYISGQAMIFPDNTPDSYIMVTIKPETREEIFKIADTIKFTE